MAKKTIKSDTKKTKTSTTIARSDDGTIQITFTIPFADILAEREKAIKILAKDVEVPGFRKGKAPIDKAIDKIPQNTLLEYTLREILPNLFSEAVSEYRLKPAIYPKFELIKATDNEDWQVRAVTCELPEIELGDYKKEIADSKSQKIWTPGDSKADKPPAKEEKEQKVIEILLKIAKIQIPAMIIKEEVDTRLSQLLQRLEKLGLNLESYLASINKKAETLRAEYKEQARNSLTLELTLNKIARNEGISVDEKAIDDTIEASSHDEKARINLNTPEQRKLIRGILLRRKVLDYLTGLI